MWITIALAAHAEVPVDLGVGAFFNAGGVFMTQPTDNRDGDPGLPYNGFAGFSPGGGLSFEARYHEIVGLEIDLSRWSQQASTEFTVNGVSYPWKVKQGAWQLPILLKLTAPIGMVRPNVFVGPEIVFPGEATITEPDWTADVALEAHADRYTLWTFGLGFETKLPTPKVDLRIPFSIRLSDNAGLPPSAYDRAIYYVDGAPWDQQTSGVLTGIDYTTEWKYQAAVTLGLQYYFY